MRSLGSRLRGFRDEWLDDTRHPAASFLIQSVALLAIFLFLNKYFHKRSIIDEGRYSSPVLVFELCMQWKSLLFLSVAGAPLAIAFRHLKWSNWSEGRKIRGFVIVVTLTLGWAFSTYQYNFYLGQAHYLDRLILAGLVLAVAWHPGFLPLFIMVALLIVNQFDVPLHRYSWTDKLVLFDILVLATSFALLRVILRKANSKVFITFAFSLLASHYFYSGIRKLELGWLSVDQLAYLFHAAYDNGWLQFIGAAGFDRVYAFLELFNFPMLVFTLIVEAGAIVAFVHRRLAVAFCLGWFAMHGGIFLSSGIFFWKWMILDVCFAIYLWRNPIRLEAGRFARHLPAAVSMALIACSILLWDTETLGWYDTPLSGVFRAEAIDGGERPQEIAPRDMAPFDFPFAQGRFQYLSEEPVLVGTLGTTSDLALLESIESISTIEEFDALKARRERTRPNRRKVRRLEKFYKKYFRTLNEREGRGTILNVIGAPQHIWTAPSSAMAFRWNSPITRLRIRYVETLFDGEKSVVMRERIVMEIDIEQSELGESATRH